MESTVNTSLRYHDEHKDSSFLSIIFMAYSETQSLNQLFENALWMTFFP